MARKLTCSITGNWSYCGEERYQKLVAQFGSEEALTEGYQSRAGKKLVAENDGDVAKARKAAQGNHKNKIACTVTGELMFISDARMKHLQEKYETDEQGVRAQYVSRVAKRLRKEAAAKVGEGDKSFDELTKTQRKEIDRELKARFDAGDWPAPAAPKGSKQKVEKTTASTPKPKAKKPATETRDTTPDNTLDPLRHIEGESAKERKNRIRRERRAMATA